MTKRWLKCIEKIQLICPLLNRILEDGEFTLYLATLNY